MANSLHSANGNHTVPVPGQEDTQYVVVQESDACDAILPNDPKIGVTEIQEFAAKHEERQVQYSGKRALQILVIDDTAVIETSRIGIGKFDRNRQEIKKEKKKKKPKRRDVKAWKRKENVEEGNHSHVSVEKKGKKRLNLVYSREEMEALRFEGLEDQKRKWVEVYCELGALVAQEYDGLMRWLQRKRKSSENPCALKIGLRIVEDIGAAYNEYTYDGLKGTCSAQVSTSWGPASSRPTPIKSR
ncbi:hypothetical protein DH2020_043356 [Rehmannia glutinosa]|uniref:Uncharacterized protein n=1 Tax=Rehmannia glutinosa TaxID=99300 RepID=A0ABR0UL28_REHGL